MGNRSISIFGAGLVGSLAALLFKKQGYDVKVYEARHDMRNKEYAGGRSINLALSDRGWKALKMAGIDKVVKQFALPMNGRLMHDKESNTTYQPYGKEGQAIYSVSRGGLNRLLVDQAEKEGVKFLFNHKVEWADFDKNEVHIINTETNEKKNVYDDRILAADGAFSGIRHAMQFTNRFNLNQFYIDAGYLELTIPANEDGSFKMREDVLHIWPRGNYMLIALPNPDASFTCTLFFPFEGNPSFESLDTDKKITAFFKEQFPDALAEIPDLISDYKSVPPSALVTIRCYPWVKGNTLLVGDASHAIVPFYGQGMNSGFEDCTVLFDELEKHNHDWLPCIDSFQKRRKPDADAISELALNNFIEMRDKVADEKFLLQKKLEGKIQDAYPDKWLPLYSRVTFSHEPYHEALAKGKEQDEFMKAHVLSSPKAEEALTDEALLKSLVESHLE